jgi:hypothetical protein
MHKLYEKFAADIERVGRTVLGVGADDDAPPFAYTVGNWLTHELPELLVIGFIDNWMLNKLSEIMINRGGSFTDGEIVDLGGAVPVMIINASKRAKADFTIQAGRFYGHERYAVQQVLIPDKRGRFPDDPTCEPPYSEMPMLRALNS